MPCDSERRATGGPPFCVTRSESRAATAPSELMVASFTTVRLGRKYNHCSIRPPTGDAIL